MTETLRERVRERLIRTIYDSLDNQEAGAYTGSVNCLPVCEMDGHFDLGEVADAILREFRLQPVAVGKVTGEGEVEGI